MSQQIQEKSELKKRLDQDIDAEEKYVVTTIETRTRQERDEIAGNYDKTISDTNLKLKSVEVKRESVKKKESQKGLRRNKRTESRK